jgi:hypothetical protein
MVLFSSSPKIVQLSFSFGVAVHLVPISIIATIDEVLTNAMDIIVAIVIVVAIVIHVAIR